MPLTTVENSTSSGHFSSAISCNERNSNDVYKLLYDSVEKHDAALEEIHKEVINLREEVKVLKGISKRTQPVSLIDETRLPPLPVKTPDQLDELETTLKDETEKNYLVNRLSVLGGRSSRSVVNNIMNYVIGREVAIFYSLHGRCSKKCFTELDVYSCIFGT